MTDARQFLTEYAQTGNESAFQEVVRRFVDLVYSTAVRMTDGNADLAKDVTQNVFVDLAKMAGSLSRDVMLGGWLHRHTCYLASKTMRSERRRQLRERRAMEMNSNDDQSAANLERIAPVLDEAINDLSGADRAAIVARFYEQRDYRGVGEAIGGSEEAARKRVDRALEKLEGNLKRRGIALSATALASALGAGAVTAAPVGLAVAVGTTAVATAAGGGGTALAILYVMNATKTQIAIAGALALAVSVPLMIQHQTNSRLEEENVALKQQVQQVATLTTENQRLSNLVARAPQPAATTAPSSSELLKLRGEVGGLRRTAEEAAAAAAARSNAPSMLGGMTQNPEVAKMIRDQQKMAMSSIYKTFADKTKLPKETTEQFNDLLADHVMTNIDHVTVLLKQGKTLAEMEPVFAAEEKNMEQRAAAMLGPDNFAKYQDYTQNLAAFITAEQFSGMMEGEKEAKVAKGKQFMKVLQEETQRVLAAQGLPPNYQTLPTLNFRNIASEEAGEKSIQLLDSIYASAVARPDITLTPKDLEKFEEFRKLVINNNRLGLTVNRKMMAPPTN